MTAQVEAMAVGPGGDGSITAMFKWIQWTIDTHELVEATGSLSPRTACVKVLDVVPDHGVQVSDLAHRGCGTQVPHQAPRHDEGRHARHV